MTFHTGGGIVADSDPDAEYEETLHKAEGPEARAGGGAGRPRLSRGRILRRHADGELSR